MTTAQTIIGLARELEGIESRRAAILAEIAFAAGPPQPPAQAPAADPRQVSWVPEEQLVAARPPRAPAAPRNGLTAKVAALLLANPSGISVEALSTALGVGHKNVRNVLSKLKTSNCAVVISRGVWGAP